MTKKKAIYVPVGEFRVTNDNSVELWTVTASCVAFILTDTVHHVIGMLHVVLPGQRNSLRKDDRDAYFADTGAPLLMNEMQKAGSDNNCLSAILVGGGSLFQWQEGVDIGQDNLNALKTFLKRHNIPIIREETGGAEGRRVSLQTGFQSLLIETIKYSKTDDKKRLNIQPPKGLNAYIDELEKIPSDTSLKDALLSEIHAHEVNWEHVCDIVSRDPILTHYFFRLINSPYYGADENITSFVKARQLIAKPHLRRICVVVFFAGNKGAKPSLTDDLIQDWRNHSLASAFIAGHLSETLLPSLKEEAYLLGLFHSLGHLCIALKNTEEKTHDVYNTSEEDHAAGLALTPDLMRFWNYPDIFSGAVSSDLTKTFNPQKKTDMLSAILHVSCWITRLIGLKTQVESDNFILNKDVMKSLGLSDSIHTLLPPILNGLKTMGLKGWKKK